MTDIKTQAQTMIRNAEAPTSAGGRAITADELKSMKAAITTSSHPRLLSDELNKATSNLTGPQQKELQDFADQVTNARASSGDTFLSVLSALNNINRINPVSWVVNKHLPFTKPE